MKTKHVTLKTLIFATALLVAATQSVSANPPGGTDPARARIFYLGTNNDRYSVQLVLENADRDTYLITVKDEADNILYTERTNVQVYRKKFHFETTAFEYGEITVDVYSRKSGTTQKFLINKKVTTQEQVVVTEVNK